MEYERLSKLLEYTPDDSELVKQLSYLIDITLYRRYPVKIDKKPAKYITKEDRINGNIYIDEDYLVSYSLKYELRQKKKRAELITKAQSMMKKPGKYQATFLNIKKIPILRHCSFSIIIHHLHYRLAILFNIAATEMMWKIEIYTRQISEFGQFFYNLFSRIGDKKHTTIVFLVKTTMHQHSYR